MSEPNYRYAAFISYRHEPIGRKWATWLHKTIERYRVPKSLQKVREAPPRVGKVFRDEEELAASADLSVEIDRALVDSKFLIVICTPRTPHSKWVNEEVKRFRELGRGDRILALLAEGEPKESFPPALVEIRRSAVDSDGAKTESVDTIEPLAADVRNVHNEKESHVTGQASLRLIATLLGVGYDELVRRDARARMGRAAATAGVALLVTTLMAGLALYAFAQKKAAAEERDRAEKLFDAVQELAEVMVFDVHDLVRPLAGSTPAINMITVTAKKYLEDLEVAGGGEVRPKLSRSISAMYNRLGDAQMIAGSSREAENSFSRSLVNAEFVFRAAPNSVEAARDLAASLSRVAGALAENDLNAAMQLYQRARTTLELIVRANPEDKQSCRSLSLIYNKIGGVQQSQSDLQAAVDSHREALRLIEDLATRYPADDQVLRDLSVARLFLADALFERSDLESAARQYQQALTIRLDLAKRNPRSAAAKRDLATNHQRLGTLHERKLDLVSAAREYEENVRIMERLTQDDPQHAFDALNLAIALQKLGSLERQQGDFEAALPFFARALAITKNCADLDPSNKSTRFKLAVAYAVAARTYAACRDLSTAAQHCEAAISIYETLTADDAANAEVVSRFAFACGVMADIRNAQNNFELAAENYDRAIQILNTLVGADPRNEENQRSLSIRYNSAGDFHVARNALSRAVGYYESSLTIRKRLAEQHLEDTDAQRNLAFSYERLAALHSQMAHDQSRSQAQRRASLEAARQFATREVEAWLAFSNRGKLSATDENARARAESRVRAIDVELTTPSN